MNPCNKECSKREVGCKRGCLDRLMYELIEKPKKEIKKNPYKVIRRKGDLREYYNSKQKRDSISKQYILGLSY